jgi:hypothetical protein
MIIELLHMLIPFMHNGDVQLMYKNIVFMILLILAKVIDRNFYKFYLWVLYIYSISA